MHPRPPLRLLFSGFLRYISSETWHTSPMCILTLEGSLQMEGRMLFTFPSSSATLAASLALSRAMMAFSLAIAEQCSGRL